MIDLHSIDQLLLAIASAVVATCAPVLLIWLNAHLKIAAKSAMSTDLDNAIQAAGRIALDALGSVAAHNPALPIRNAAVAAGVNYAVDASQTAIASFGITPDKIAGMVSGELAHLLHTTTPPDTAAAAPADPAIPVSLAAPAKA
jgi:hypothetical protein